MIIMKIVSRYIIPIRTSHLLQIISAATPINPSCSYRKEWRVKSDKVWLDIRMSNHLYSQIQSSSPPASLIANIVLRDATGEERPFEYIWQWDIYAPLLLKDIDNFLSQLSPAFPEISSLLREGIGGNPWAVVTKPQGIRKIIRRR